MSKDTSSLAAKSRATAACKDKMGQCKIADIDAGALFAVWEPNDLDKLILRLTTLKRAMESGKLTSPAEEPVLV